MGSQELAMPDYLCFTALEDGTFTFTIQSNVPTNKVSYISYSVDNGSTWVTVNNTNNTEVVVTTPVIQTGDRVFWRGSATAMANNNFSNGHTTVSSSGKFDVSGNILSLLYDKKFMQYTTTRNNNNTFYRLFDSSKVVDASNLLMPETGSKANDYAYMFYNCSELISAPSEFPVVTQEQSNCYEATFQNCVKLVNAPVIKSRNLGGRGMFNRCSSLVSVPQITLDSTGINIREFFMGCVSLTNNPFIMTENAGFVSYGAANCFRDCTSLLGAGTIRAKTSASHAFDSMFYGCTSLTQAPTLDTPLAEFVYIAMFQNCTALTNAPKLDIVTLTKGCYQNMFRGCTNLITAPVLPSTTLMDSCYSQMFRSSGVTWVKMLATDISATSCLSNWTWGVGNTSNRIFVKHIDAQWTTTGNSGVPTNWTVIYYNPTTDKYYLSDKTTECDDHGNPI